MSLNKGHTKIVRELKIIQEMEKIKQTEILFAITREDLQFAAKEKIGRELTNDEIEIARKGLEYGFMTDIDTIYNTIFNEMIK